MTVYGREDSRDRLEEIADSYIHTNPLLSCFGSIIFFFIAVTLYDEYHMFYANEIERQSLGTKSRSLKEEGDGGLIFYVSHTSPGKDLESNWLPAPEGPFSLYIRLYWPLQAILDGTWKPPIIKAVAH